MTDRDAHAPRSVLICFALSVLGAAAFATSYVMDWGNRAYGASLGWALLFLGIGLGIWAQLIDEDEPDYVEERAVGPTDDTGFERFRTALTEQKVPRSGVLWSMLGVAAGSIGLAALFPLRSLFPTRNLGPGAHALLSDSPWRAGDAVVTEGGEQVRPDDLAVGSVLTVFPATWDPRQSAGATLLIRVDPEQLELPASRRDWVADGVIAYSKLCTHAGCPVGLYSDESAQLLCPCHHSVFDVLDGGKPVEGPAAHPLPQLPLALDSEGYLIATGEFTRAPGAAWWGW
ncbi:ubiquinol-cytochrome c reductase iron-sulfur subunit [Nocardioides terrisoli]|uniref:ubiquinol-cytochrome c reductase iron-sulfur subunit n=1 Tax=Nocardioides terrisoli TaxID=3388267 RepID=UPI00287B78F6|nr:Rieske 2Fe-2S domain-containing protein [Nocardioides marmorisolisilvae]